LGALGAAERLARRDPDAWRTGAQVAQGAGLGIPIDPESLAQLDEASATIAREKGRSPGPLSRRG